MARTFKDMNGKTWGPILFTGPLFEQIENKLGIAIEETVIILKGMGDGKESLRRDRNFIPFTVFNLMFNCKASW